jgi:single-strand DNA-binding protein
MSNSINSAVVSGHIGEPKVTTTQGGATFLNFSVAARGGYTDKATGEWKEKTDWIDCKMFGKRAESLSRFLTKGTFVVVLGSISQETWEKDGKRRSKIVVFVHEIQLAPRAKGGEPVQHSTRSEESESDDDIPF